MSNEYLIDLMFMLFIGVQALALMKLFFDVNKLDARLIRYENKIATGSGENGSDDGIKRVREEIHYKVRKIYIGCAGMVVLIVAYFIII